MRVLITDDEPLARRRLRAMLAEMPEVELVGECGSGDEVLAMLPSSQPDIVFLDIQMPGLSGLDLAKRLESMGNPAVVFVTAHAEHALEAFELAATDYLLKPFSKDRLAATLERLRERVGHKQTGDLTALIEELKGHHYPQRLPIPGRSRVVFIDVPEIDRVEADGNYVVVHVGSKTHLLRSTLNDVQKQLDPKDFVRIHRSHLVRRDRIRELRTSPSGGHHVVLRNEEQLPVGRTYTADLLG